MMFSRILRWISIFIYIDIDIDIHIYIFICLGCGVRCSKFNDIACSMKYK